MQLLVPIIENNSFISDFLCNITLYSKMSQKELVGDNVPTKSTLSSSSWKPGYIEVVSEPCERDFELGPCALEMADTDG